MRRYFAAAFAALALGPPAGRRDKIFQLECEVRVGQIKIPQNAPPAP